MIFSEFIAAVIKFDSRYEKCSWTYGDSGKYSATSEGMTVEWDKYFTLTVSGSTSIGRGDTVEDAFFSWEYAESLNRPKLK